MPEKTYNGIVLPDEWPPGDVNLASWQPMRVPWLDQPPPVIPVDLGRQLFVDDFLVETTTMTRVFHRPVKDPGNPVLFPQGPEECHPDYPPCAVAKCGGVWYDDRDGRFRMWYMAGYVGAMAYAESDDGIRWRRPELDIVPGTNLCLPRDLHPDSGTVWLDREAAAGRGRYKMLLREPDGRAHARAGRGGPVPGLVMTSDDGIHWGEPRLTGPMGDRSTMFHNPFRRAWVQSIRSRCPRGRSRHYREAGDFFAAASWEAGEPVPWAGADCLDEAGDSLPQLYNLDAVAYESVLLGVHQVLKGPPNDVCALSGRPKLTELTLGYSRDGFHWHRPDRRAFIGAERVPGSWEYGYLEPSGGVCLVVGDELWFYYSAYGGDPARLAPGLDNGMYGNGAVGLARLRRDGFASMQARFPEAQLLTRPLTFTGGRLFVNAETAGGSLRVEIVGPDGETLAGCAAAECAGFAGNSTRAEIRWRDENALARWRGRPVRLRFLMDRGKLYAFWVTDSPVGASGGYVGAGGPGFRGSRDA